ncbi:MAG TPA: hypothetical protein VGD94_15615 [Vicinamibacterales bacterium]
MSHILFGCGYESCELTFLITGEVDQQLRVVANISEPFESKPGRHSSHSCAAAIRCRKLGG